MCLSHLIYTVRPCLIHTCHAAPMPRPCHALTIRLFSRPQKSTAVSRRPCSAVALRRTAWSGHGMTSVNQTWSHCVNQMGKTHSKPLVARHGKGTAWYLWIGLYFATIKLVLLLAHQRMNRQLMHEIGRTHLVIGLTVSLHSVLIVQSSNMTARGRVVTTLIPFSNVWKLLQRQRIFVTLKVIYR